MKEHQDLVLAIVAPIGTDIDSFISNLTTCLKSYNSSVHTISLTDIINDFTDKGLTKKLDKLKDKINLSNMARSKSQKPDLLSRFGITKINQIKSKSKNEKNVFIIRQLKRPEELSLLKELYGQSFFLLGVTASQEERLTFLTQDLYKKDITSYKNDLIKLFKTDQDEQSDSTAGQKVIKVFSKSDVFFHQNAKQNEIYRFLDLLHCSPFISPKKDEILMNLAFSTSTKSIDLSRQVGAVIADQNGDLISVGANDVPKAGGGQYSDDDEHHFPDWILGKDPNKDKIASIINEILNEFSEKVSSEEKKEEIITNIKKTLSDSDISNLTEFNRAVHAEMEAILNCARQGKATKNAVLYCTTFPCHNCAKHIVGAGIKKVFFIEPYPKSLALDLHNDSISESDSNLVIFTQFTGIGPNRFNDLFSLSLTSGKKVSRKNDDGQIVNFVRHQSEGKFAYTQEVADQIEQKEKNLVSEFAELFNEEFKNGLRKAS